MPIQCAPSPAHLGQPGDLAPLLPRHQQHHGVTADPPAHQRARGHLGRGVVRAPGAEVRRARGERQAGPLARRGGRRQIRHARAGQAAHEPVRDGVGVQFAERGQQRAAVRPVLAVHRRRAGHPVEHGFHRVLQEGPLLLDHDDLVEAAGELPDDGRLEREDQAELQQPDAGPVQPVLVEPGRGQRLAQREIAGAGGDDADPRGGRAGDLVDAAAARVLQGEGQADLMERALQPGQRRPRAGARSAGVRTR